MVTQHIADGGNMRDLCAVATSIQSVKHAECLLKYLEAPRSEKPSVYWFWGKTGVGKTYTAFKECDPAPFVLSNGKWWDGYDGHQNVIIDDLRPEMMPLRDLLRILDRYPVAVQVKGGQRQLVATHIYITAPLDPGAMYRHMGEDVKQLLRRIDEVRHIRETVI